MIALSVPSRDALAKVQMATNAATVRVRKSMLPNQPSRAHEPSGRTTGKLVVREESYTAAPYHELDKYYPALWTESRKK